MKNTLYINYTKAGKAISDHETESVLIEQSSICINGQNKQFNVSTENVINAARAMKLEGKITCNLIIMFEGIELEMNEYCKISDWPKGFCDYNENWAGKILSLSINKKRKLNTY